MRSSKSKKTNDKKGKKPEAEEARQVPLGDLLRPVFSATGELMGVQLSCNLVPMMHKAQGYETLALKRAIKACAYINRLLAEGHREDFVMKALAEVGAGGTLATKELADAAIQVDALELERNEAGDADGAEAASAESPAAQLLACMKQHVAVMLGRMHEDHVAFYGYVLRNMDFDKLAAFKLDSIFLNKEQQADLEKITFADYIGSILGQVRVATASLADDQQQVLYVEGLLGLGKAHTTAQMIK